MRRVSVQWRYNGEILSPDILYNENVLIWLVKSTTVQVSDKSETSKKTTLSASRLTIMQEVAGASLEELAKSQCSPNLSYWRWDWLPLPRTLPLGGRHRMPIIRSFTLRCSFEPDLARWWILSSARSQCLSVVITWRKAMSLMRYIRISTR